MLFTNLIYYSTYSPNYSLRLQFTYNSTQYFTQQPTVLPFPCEPRKQQDTLCWQLHTSLSSSFVVSDTCSVPIGMGITWHSKTLKCRKKMFFFRRAAFSPEVLHGMIQPITISHFWITANLVICLLVLGLKLFSLNLKCDFNLRVIFAPWSLSYSVKSRATL